MIHFFNVIFYQPIFNLLVWLYNIIPGHDIGVAVLLLTVLLKAILYPLSKKALQSQKAMQAIQPKLKEIQEKYKDDKQAQTKAVMEFYSREKVSPFSSCLPLLIQFPFLIALYQALMNGLKSAKMEMLYPFVHNPGQINVISMGFLDLSKANYVLAILAGLAQFWQGKMLATTAPKAKTAGEGGKDESMTAMMNKQMIYFMPAITVFIGISLPGGLTLYWLITTLLTVLQQWWFFRSEKKPAVEIIKK